MIIFFSHIYRLRSEKRHYLLNSFVTVEGKETVNPLILACALNEMEIIRALLPKNKRQDYHGVDVNVSGNVLLGNDSGTSFLLHEGLTPLHIAFYHGDCDLTDLLLENNADIDAR